MFLYEGYTCPVCLKPFLPEDDVVVCPDCGAPHHRACWKQEKHCHFFDKHGTAQQWTREKAQHTTFEKQNICPHCGYNNTLFSEFCSRCGNELNAQEWVGNQANYSAQTAEPSFRGYGEYRPFQAPAPEVRIPNETEIDGVTAKELYMYTGKNGHYYVTRFQKLQQKRGSFSWNWAAFLLTPYWLWYRKQYLMGSIALLLEGIRTVVTAFFLYSYIGFSNIVSNQELITRLELLSQNTTFHWWVSLLYVMLFISGFMRLFFGCFGNYIYFKTAKKHIIRLRNNLNDFALSTVGGVSMALGVTAYIILYLVSTLSNFLFL